MELHSIQLLGLRGFSDRQELVLARPCGRAGSGLTTLVGPNNSGKSTVVEAFRAITQRESPSFTEGQRNKQAGDRVEVAVADREGRRVVLRTVASGGSQTEFSEEGVSRSDLHAFVVPSRRTFAPFFGRGTQDRNQYVRSATFPSQRGSSLSNFNYRLFHIQEKQSEFNEVLRKVVPDVPVWHIEQSDRGDYYLKFDFEGSFHNSDGLGEGLLSVFTIVDALYDSQEHDLILIDEPELSLHPALQKRLTCLLREYAATRQILIATHSPYFIDWESLGNGGAIARVVKKSDRISIHQLPSAAIKDVSGLLSNLNNPHILGLAAREVFFLEDRIVLVEGQEDVIFLRRALNQASQALDGYLWGWGAGGAPNIGKLLAILRGFGYERVACILDGNMRDCARRLKEEYPEYLVVVIPADDIRDKPARLPRPPVSGLMDSAGTSVKPEHQDALSRLVGDINTYLNVDRDTTKPCT